MKKIDWYIIQKFLVTFFFFVIAFVVIAIVIDTAENIDALIESDARFDQIILKYYFPLCIHFGNLLSPFLVFIAVIWITSRMAQQTEIVAMLSGGVSFRRLLVPYMVAGLFVTLLVLIFSHFFVPMASKAKFEFAQEFMQKRTYFEHHTHRELAENKHYYFRSIDGRSSTGWDLSIEDWDEGRLVKKLMAHKAVFDTTQNQWILTHVKIRTMYADGLERIDYMDRVDTTLAVRFDNFGQRDEVVKNMKTPELNEYLIKEKMRGSSKVKVIEIERDMRTANAFSIMVLGFIAVATAARKSRRGLGVHLLAAIIIGLVFLFTSRVSSVSVTNAGIPAYIAVWIPNVVFGLIGLFIYARAPK